MTKRYWLIPVIAVLLFVIGVIGASFLKVLASARVAATKSSALSNLKQLSNAWLMYGSDNNDKTCGTKNWNQDVARYCSAPIEEVIRNPLVTDGSDQRNFGLNRDLSFIDLTIQDSEANLVVFATTSTPGANALVSKEMLAPYLQESPWFMYSGIAGDVRSRVFSNERARLAWQPVRAKK
ncbi:MAG TPA: hypothetical protein VK171_15140 [Fimbriimonas sp.]|nr:hypothetical protein [Fimbriimonas sp.]